MAIKQTLVTVLTLVLTWTGSYAQIHKVPDQVRRDALAAEAHIERMVMVPMRDGVELASRVYIPKDGDGPFPVILWRSPYDFSEKKIPNPEYSDANLKFALDAVRHGYVFIMQNERGKFFSEGDWEILGRPRTDGHDTMTWIADQPWSNGRVGTIGCSSTAEWIMGLASERHPAHKAAVPPLLYSASSGCAPKQMMLSFSLSLTCARTSGEPPKRQMQTSTVSDFAALRIIIRLPGWN